MKVCWSESEGQNESLAVCLRSLLAGQGLERGYDELVSTLGLGAAIVSVPGECLGGWCAHARDGALPDTAELYGVRLRDLHPAQAAVGLDRSAEFAAHFTDSYVPLILRALASGQLAFAWRGWPGPLDRFWGIIERCEGTSLLGRTLRNDGKPTPLVGPAMQVYVVEECRPPAEGNIRPAALLAHAVRITQAQKGAERGEIRTGFDAFEDWMHALAEDAGCPRCGENTQRCQSRMTRELIAARASLGRWLRGIADDLESADRITAERWADACERVVKRLTPIASEQALQPLLATPKGRAEIRVAIEDVQSIESHSAETLEAAE